MKANPNSKPIPAVVLTCSREERDLVMGYDPGHNAYVIRPTESYDFADFIREPGPLRTGVAHPGYEAWTFVDA